MDIYNPDYYRTGKIEVADFIADKNFNFFLGNVVKYVSRAGKKEGNSKIQDLRKALWYLNKEIKCAEKEKSASDTVADYCISMLRGSCCNKSVDEPTMTDDEYADACATITNIIFSDDDCEEYPYTEADFGWNDCEAKPTRPKRRRDGRNGKK